MYTPVYVQVQVYTLSICTVMAIYMGSTLYTCMYIYRPIYCLYVVLYKQLYVMDLQAWVVSSTSLYECSLSGWSTEL